VVEHQIPAAALVGDMYFCHRHHHHPADTIDWSTDDWDGADVIAWIAARTGLDPRVIGRVIDAEAAWLRATDLDD